MNAFKYLMSTIQRMQNSLSVLRRIKTDFMSEDTAKNLRHMRRMILLETVLLMTTPWIFGALVNKALSKETVWVTGLLVIIVSLIMFRVFVSLSSGLSFEKNDGDARMHTDSIIGKIFLGKNIKQLQIDKNLSIANIADGREYMNHIVGGLQISLVRQIANVAIAYLATMIGSLAFDLPLIGISATVGLIIAIIFSAYLNTKVIEDTEAIDEGFRAYNQQYKEMIDKFSAFKAQGMERKIILEVQKKHKEVFSADRIFWFWYIKKSELRELIIVFLVIVMAYIIGVYHIITKPESLPLVIAMFSWGGIQTASLRELSRLERDLNKRLPAIVSLFKALDLPALKKESGSIRFDKHEPFDVVFDKVSHWYEDGELALSNIDFKIQSGEKWAFIGESGSGKTTIINLLLASMPPAEGNIFIVLQKDGRKINLWDLDLEWWRSEVLGYVPQDVVLKNGTIRDNLHLAVPESKSLPTDEELMELLQRFSAVFRGYNDSSFLDIVVGRDGGIELSGGQRQRIGIVRAILKDARLFIFDEATSSLDAQTTNNVTQSFSEALSPDITSIMIAHNLSTVAGGSPKKLLDNETTDENLVCNHYLVLRPVIRQFQIDVEVNQIDYAGYWKDLSKSEVMKNLIHESQKEIMVN